MVPDYSPTRQTTPSRSAHDHVFTGLALALAFLLLLSAVSMRSMLHNPSVAPESRWVFRMSIGVMACYVVLIALALVLRWALPASRRVFTIALSVVLLLYVPLGTALGIYGLWKVDRPPRAEPQA
jgi:hypothetical protein